MKKFLLFTGMLLLLALQGCAVVGGILKAGVWVGILIVAVIVIIIGVIVSKARK
jgi:hypothetical protein